jgi:hypothetical protein
MRELEVKIGIVGSDQIAKIKMIARELDIERGGHFDSRNRAVNIWCSPEDKPDSWEATIDQCCLNYPRCIVGTLQWEWLPNNDAELTLYTCPYELEEQDKPIDLEDLVKWLQGKVSFLIDKSK